MRRNSKFEKLLDVLFFTLIIGAIIWLMTMWASIPIVEWSYSKDICMGIYPPDSDYNCENLPNHYELVWVQ